MVFERPHLRLAGREGMWERTLTLSSLGKTFSLTGWKVGWAIGPPDLTRAVRAAHQFLTFTTPTPVQHGAVAALDAPRLSTTTCEWATGRNGTFWLVGWPRRVRGPPHRGHLLHDGGVPGVSDADDREFCRHGRAGRGGRHSPSVFYRPGRRPRAGPVRLLQGRGDAHRGRGEAGQALHRLITAGRYRARQYPRSHACATSWSPSAGRTPAGRSTWGTGGAYLPPDIFARYHRLAENRVLMVSGSDAHGTPITVKADQEGTTPQEVVDRYHPEILGYWDSLGSRSTSSPPP